MWGGRPRPPPLTLAIKIRVNGGGQYVRPHKGCAMHPFLYQAI